MSQEISAKIHWEHQDAKTFQKGKYSRTHIWELDSGNQIDASSSPHIVPVPFSDPAFIDPEEAFICSLASCHMLFFLSIAAKKGISILRYDDTPIGMLAKNDSNKMAMTEVILQPVVKTWEELDPETLREIHESAHENCFIANSVKSVIKIKQN